MRQSVRFDDFASISEANPPRTTLGRVAYGVGQAVVDGLGALDRALENTQVRGGSPARRGAGRYSPATSVRVLPGARDPFLD